MLIRFNRLYPLNYIGLPVTKAEFAARLADNESGPLTDVKHICLAFLSRKHLAFLSRKYLAFLGRKRLHVAERDPTATSASRSASPRMTSPSKATPIPNRRRRTQW